MKKKGKHRAKGKIVVRFFLLAILCVGGVELAVCRVMDPALYQRVTAPVRQMVSVAWDKSRTAAQTVAVEWSEWREKRAEWRERRKEAEPVLGASEKTENPVVPSQSNQSEAGGTGLVLRDGQEILTGGSVEIVYYNQSSAPWAEQPYGNDKIGGYGCGPTAMAMAVSSLTGQMVNPAQMANWAVQNGHWASGSGSRLSIVEDAAAAYGLSAWELRDFTPDGLRRELSNGGMVVALMGKGHFTDGGHFILLRGILPDGTILVADSNSVERSLVPWNAQLILDELSPRRVNGAPLWVLYRPMT